MSDEDRLDVIYNATCPVCRAGVESFQKAAPEDARARTWRDINADPELLAAHDVSLDDVRLKLHVIDRDGILRVGMPAVAAIWAETPGWRWLAAVARAPVLRRAAAAGYHVVAHVLYRWNRLVGNF